jgi:hypothetical protein
MNFVLRSFSVVAVCVAGTAALADEFLNLPPAGILRGAAALSVVDCVNGLGADLPPDLRTPNAGADAARQDPAVQGRFVQVERNDSSSYLPAALITIGGLPGNSSVILFAAKGDKEGVYGRGVSLRSEPATPNARAQAIVKGVLDCINQVTAREAEAKYPRSLLAGSVREATPVR